MYLKRLLYHLCALLSALGSLCAFAGEAAPFNVSDLPVLGEEWRPRNPYRGDAVAAQLGKLAFNANCSRCHGVDAVASGAMPAPDLRKLDKFCRRITDPTLRSSCMDDIDDYFRSSVLAGKVIVGVRHMPAWGGLLTQETIWAVKAYIESRSEPQR